MWLLHRLSTNLPAFSKTKILKKSTRLYKIEFAPEQCTDHACNGMTDYDRFKSLQKQKI